MLTRQRCRKFSAGHGAMTVPGAARNRASGQESSLPCGGPLPPPLALGLFVAAPLLIVATGPFQEERNHLVPALAFEVGDSVQAFPEPPSEANVRWHYVIERVWFGE